MATFKLVELLRTTQDGAKVIALQAAIAKYSRSINYRTVQSIAAKWDAQAPQSGLPRHFFRSIRRHLVLLGSPEFHGRNAGLGHHV